MRRELGALQYAPARTSYVEMGNEVVEVVVAPQVLFKEGYAADRTLSFCRFEYHSETGGAKTVIAWFVQDWSPQQVSANGAAHFGVKVGEEVHYFFAQVGSL